MASGVLAAQLSLTDCVDGRSSNTPSQAGGFGNRLARMAYSQLGFRLLRHGRRKPPVVVYYHVVSDEPVPHIGNLYQFRSSQQFRRDMDLLSTFFEPISLQALIEARRNGRQLSEKAILITFDDGLKQCHNVIEPILREKGIPGTFFVCSAFTDNKQLAYDHKKSWLSQVVTIDQQLGQATKVKVQQLLSGIGIIEKSNAAGLLQVEYKDRDILDTIAQVIGYDFADYLTRAQPYLTSKQLNELANKGHAIGAHSIDHPRYQDIPLAEQVNQTLTSVRFVRNQFNLPYGAFSFPHSDAGVSAEFFGEIFDSKQVDICFGNRGLLLDEEHRNLQRTSMENTDASARAVLGRALARRLLRTMTGRGMVCRARSASK